MTLKQRLVVGIAALAVLGCTSGDDPSETTIGGDLAPAQVVTSLFAAIDAGRFDDAANLTDLDHAALLSLVEGANVTEVAEALTDEAVSVASNFWSGFAQTLDASFSPGNVTVSEGEVIAQGEARFVTVTVQPADGEARSIVVRRNGDAWVVDLFATFGSALSERLLAPVESILTSANADAALVRTRLSESADSLLMAASDPSLPTAAHQSLLALIERVTRTPG
ncbi:hypothetical protein BH23ACT5_BH23ACT5_13320 [soil metagenome]